MRSWPFAAVSVLALALAGCNLLPKPQRAVTRLTCPKTQGVLTRTSVAPNGKSCRYTTANGGEVELRLVPVTDSVEHTLAALEAEALALAKPTPANAQPAAAPATVKAAADTEAQAAADAGVQVPDKADETDDETAQADDEDVDIDLPGLHISTEGEAAKIRLGGLQVDAGGSGAVVRKTWDVRLRGEQASMQKRGVRALFIKVDGDGGDRPGVGYQAAGPKRGPLTAALVRWSSGDSEELYDDVRKLVRDNGGA